MQQKTRRHFYFEDEKCTIQFGQKCDFVNRLKMVKSIVFADFDRITAKRVVAFCFLAKENTSLFEVIYLRKEQKR